MTAFIDSAIFMYANGSEHPLREPCRAILEDIARRRLLAATSAEVVQEILHRYIAVQRAPLGLVVARTVIESFAPLAPITHAVMARMPALVERYPRLAVRDLVHVATCLEEGLSDIVSPDRAFDEVSEIRRIDPASAWSR